MSLPVRVKVCGITCEADALAAIEAGADALGFNAFPGSKRYLDLVAASPWIARLPPMVSRIAVVVNATRQQAMEIRALPGIDLLQFHGDEDADFCLPFAAGGFIKAVAARNAGALEAAATIPANALLLDAYRPGEYGGTGQLIDLELAAAFIASQPLERKVILSGGLTPENVADAVRAVRPYAVDVASGVEVEGDPRRKDPSRMRKFVAEAKRALSVV